MTRPYILTGAPGSGKTALLRRIELYGHAVIEEAATDVITLQQACGIAEPWTAPGFIEAVVDLQARRRAALNTAAPAAFADRSPICTYALSLFLGQAPSEALAREVARMQDQGLYQRRVLFVQNLGFVTPTAARRISFEDSLRFERLHVEAYERFGYELIEIPAQDIDRRGEGVLEALDLGARRRQP